MTDYEEEKYGDKLRGWHTQRILDVYKQMPKAPEGPPKQKPQTFLFPRRRAVNAVLKKNHG